MLWKKVFSGNIVDVVVDDGVSPSDFASVRLIQSS